MNDNYYILMVMTSWAIMIPYSIYYAAKQNKELFLYSKDMKTDTNKIKETISVFVKYAFTCIAIIVYMLAFMAMQLLTAEVSKEGIFKIYFVDTGLFTVVWLIIVGCVIRLVSDGITKRLFKAYINPETSNPYWVVAFIFSTITLFFQEPVMGLSMLALLLGKFIWIDFLAGITRTKIKEMISREYFKKIRAEIDAKIVMGDINFEVIFNETLYMLCVWIFTFILKKYEPFSGITVYIVTILAMLITLIGNKLLVMYRKKKRKLYSLVTWYQP